MPKKKMWVEWEEGDDPYSNDYKAKKSELALMLNDWRIKTNDVIPSEFAGTRISERFTDTYLRNHGPAISAVKCRKDSPVAAK